MKEKKKVEKQTTGGDGSLFDSVPGLENKNVSIASGPYAEDLPVAGMTIGEVRRRFKDRFDIDDAAQTILNGNPVKDDVVLKAGEALMFVHHVGEKGAKGNEVILRDTRAYATTDEDVTLSLDIVKLGERMGPLPSTGELVIPLGVRSILSRGAVTLWIWEKPPHIATLRWISANSPVPYGGGVKYRNVHIALPYLIIVSVFVRDGQGLPNLTLRDECFFRTSPLKSLDDELLFPALLNCSRWPQHDAMNHPLSWICTQFLKRNERLESDDPGERFQAGFEAVRYCLLETGFNLSSEHHEGNSWYGASKKVDPRIATVEQWEKETKKDPLFILEVPWLKAKHTVRQLADRIFTQHAQTDGQVRTAADVARLIAHAS